jgi:glyoxylase-like metal-dependent hydrolase (beta-lactamase superfamily II)
MSIHTIDLDYLGIPGAIAAYVVIQNSSRPVLIETGPASTLDALRAGLAALGIAFADIEHALVTHIHLDHAGAAGHLARHGAMIHVHEFGAKHLADPARLIASATRIYGEQMDRLWGSIVPVPPDKLAPVHDHDPIKIGGLRFTAIETPGHARHHHAFELDTADGRVCFAGDIAGITIPGVDPSQFLAIPTPPPEFDLDAWRASLKRVRGREYSAIYPTHFGRSEGVNGHLQRLDELLIEHVELIRSERDAGRSRAEILRRYVAQIRQQAAAIGLSDAQCSMYLSTNLLTMNVDGVLRWLEKQAEVQTHQAG